MTRRSEALGALEILRNYINGADAVPTGENLLTGEILLVDTEDDAVALEHEIHGERFFTVTGNWIPSRERYSAKIWARDRRAAEDQVRAEVQAVWEDAGMTGPAEFLISACFYGEPEQADVGARTSDD